MLPRFSEGPFNVVGGFGQGGGKAKDSSSLTNCLQYIPKKKLLIKNDANYREHDLKITYFFY